MDILDCDKVYYTCKYCGAVNYAHGYLYVACLNSVRCGKCKMPLD